jgi:hypothetical protein
MRKTWVERDYRCNYRGFTIIHQAGTKSVKAYINGERYCTKTSIPAIKKEIDALYALIDSKA